MIEFYDHKCGCGCGAQIQKKTTHRWDGIPKYILGHYVRVKNPMDNLGSRKKIGLAVKGHKHYSFKGGSQIWWRKRLIKVNRECCLCKGGGRLEMHHKDGDFDHNVRENLIILCVDCHHFWHDGG